MDNQVFENRYICEKSRKQKTDDHHFFENGFICKKFCKENTEIRQEMDDHCLKTDSYVQNISKK